MNPMNPMNAPYVPANSDVNATALGSAVVPAPAQSSPDYEEHTLPSGAVARVLRHTKGKHLRLASRAIRKEFQGERIEAIFAMISVKVTYDGRPLTIEDLDELPERDVAELIELVTGKAAASRPAT